MVAIDSAPRNIHQNFDYVGKIIIMKQIELHWHVQRNCMNVRDQSSEQWECFNNGVPQTHNAKNDKYKEEECHFTRNNCFCSPLSTTKNPNIFIERRYRIFRSPQSMLGVNAMRRHSLSRRFHAKRMTAWVSGGISKSIECKPSVPSILVELIITLLIENQISNDIHFVRIEASDIELK